MYSGKVRDLYEDPDGRLLFVASDRISAYDWVLPTPIPDKGRILTAMSLWWFDRLSDIVAEPRDLHPRARRRRPPRDGLHEARHVPRRVRRARLPHRLAASWSTASRRRSAA